MATQKKELTVEEKLKALYDLQQKLSEIDAIKTLRGELPQEVQDLEDEIAGLETRESKYQDEIAIQQDEIARNRDIKAKAEELIDKYTADQDNVRNNREYDYLTKEIEYQTLNIELAEKKMNEAARRADALQGEIEKAREMRTDREHALEEKKSELNEIVSENKQKEETLREKAKKQENKIEERLLTAFKRIRKNTRNGLGVVVVQRNACGGCFNRIPAQRQMEIKMHKKIIVCEYCGRILIDPELVGIAPEEAKNK
jgi:predicted  nucleic acid-binding Zn-ribbon protein